MRVGRVGPPGGERPVARTPDGDWDLTPLTPDVTPDFLAQEGLERAASAIAGGRLPRTEIPEGTRFGPPLSRPPKMLCIGLNFARHAAESGLEPPDEPVLFAKMTNTVVGPDDEIRIPRGSTKLDYEVELAVVIGRRAGYLRSIEAAGEVVAGYTISNDVTEREFQLERGGQWVKGKSCPTFNPLGPWIVTPPVVGDPQKLDLRLWVNGELRQSSSTADMIFPCLELVRYLSQFLELEPGDVINTGTPEGVALGSDAIPYLAEGDVVELAVERLGRQRQVVVGPCG